MSDQATIVNSARKNIKSQDSVNIKEEHAVSIRHAFKRYGSKKEPIVILDGLNMTVPKGTIYGLLGASGCGKTTLLNCMVGIKQLDSGEIWVLGGTPGSKDSGVPGPRIGYMPQDIALYGEFTIRETITYFGWISEMKNKEIKDRFDFLIELLMLPKLDILVKNLSGGQQRRVSLACALLHEPELLILDEPTVGVDPLLRETIWNHLIEITRSVQTTVIITTHYIEETRQAQLIGFMRAGHFLAEESPEKLLSQFQCTTLEEVFLRLSLMQNVGRKRRMSISDGIFSAVNLPNAISNATTIIDDNELSGEFGDNISLTSQNTKDISTIFPNNRQKIPIMPLLSTDSTIKLHYFTRFSKNHMKALIWKNFLGIFRDIPLFTFVTAIPIFQMLIFCSCIGHAPKEIKVGIINYEIDDISHCKEFLHCNSTTLSCNFLNYIKRKDLTLVHYNYRSNNDISYEIDKGHVYAFIVIKQNYSAALQMRLRDLSHSHSWDIQSSEIDVYGGFSSYTITTFLKAYIYESFQEFIQDYLESCEISRDVIKWPLRINEPIYGLPKPTFADFMAPGMILTISFFSGYILTSGVMLEDLNQGSLQRLLVIGIHSIEIIVSHTITQFLVIILQFVFIALLVFVVFEYTLYGSVLLVTAITLLNGFCGFVVSSVFSGQFLVSFIGTGTYVVTTMLCGIIWPIQGMHPILKYVTVFLPITSSTESLRNIIQRGWNIYESNVYMAFIITSVWIVVFLIITILLLKFKKS